MTATPNELLRRLGYVRWGPPDFPFPTELADPHGTIHEPFRHEVLESIARPEPETNPADHDSDRLATELFRRYGSVQRGLWRGREHWVADATAIRSLLAGDAAFARVLEQLAEAPVRISGDSEAHAAAWSDGFDEAWRQRDDLDARRRRSRVELLAITIGLIAGAIAYWPVRLSQRGRR